jgi:ABC-type nickel/cobalt efflux system permease component RcnA
MLFSSFTGLLAGIIHVISGPDHIAAIAPFAIDKNEKSWSLGLFWGIGHTGGVWLIGVLAFLLREVLPIDLISSLSERLVGVILIGIGIWGIRKALTTKVHYHDHQHGSEKHAHFHIHHQNEMANHPASHTHNHTSFGIGIIHGLAGGSHIVGVMPALLMPNREIAIAYLIFFGIGSIISMTFFSYFLGWFSKKIIISLNIYNNILLGFAITAILIGVVWLFFL